MVRPLFRLILTQNYILYNWSDDGQECHGMKPSKHKGVFPVHNELELTISLNVGLKRHVHSDKISLKSNPLCTPNYHIQVGEYISMVS